LKCTLATFLTLTVALAAGAALGQEPPSGGAPRGVILEIIDSRAARLPDIERYKAGGIIGENNRGDVEILKPFKNPEKLERLELVVEGENADRERLYAALVLGRRGGAEEITGVRRSYAAMLRESARPGEWIQLPDGMWTKKKRDGEPDPD
jgi:hypothetical protein